MLTSEQHVHYRELNHMDTQLYEAGKQLLLTRREALRSVGRLQHLPQLTTNASKPHERTPRHETIGQSSCLHVGFE